MQDNDSSQYAGLLERLHRLENSLSGNFEPGDLKTSAAAVPPDGWVLCNGAAYPRDGAMATLFEALGGTASPYGLPNASTFNVPDLVGRVPVGAGTGAGLTARALGSKFGSEPSNMPSHNHGGATGTGTSGNDSPDHAHYTAAPIVAADGTGAVFTYIGNPWGGSGYPLNTNPFPTQGATARHAHSVPALAISSQGGGADNLQPSQAFNWFIKV